MPVVLQVMYEKHKDVHARLPMCYLFGYPLSLVDKPFIAHLCGEYLPDCLALGLTP